MAKPMYILTPKFLASEGRPNYSHGTNEWVVFEDLWSRYRRGQRTSISYLMSNTHQYNKAVPKLIEDGYLDYYRPMPNEERDFFVEQRRDF